MSALLPRVPRYIADEKWFEAYQVVEYRNPDTYSVNGYVAMQVLAAGVQHANTLDSDRSGGRAAAVKSWRLCWENSVTNPMAIFPHPGIWVYQVDRSGI